MNKLKVNRLHKKELPLYPVNMIFSCDGKKFEGYFNSDFEDEATSGGYCKIAFVDDTFTVGIYMKANNHSVVLSHLAHECFHASVRVCNYLGIKIEAGNDEAGAYITGNIFGWVLDCLNKDCKLQKKKNKELEINKGK